MCARKVAMLVAVVVCILVFANVCAVIAGEATNPGKQAVTTTPAPVSARTPKASSSNVSDANIANELRMLQADQQASEQRLQQAIEANKAGWLEKLWPAILGLVGVVIGGAINIWLQSKERAASEKVHHAGAAFEAQTKIIEYRSKQAHEFYYPLLLSLQRSSGVRRQLCDLLHKKDPARFQFHAKESDGREHLFIHDDSMPEPVRFRLIEAMHELATQHPETIPMVKEIVAIGEKMSTLIHDKGGLVLVHEKEGDYALSSDKTLTGSLGQYLAHYSILREVVQKAEEPAQLVGITYNALYPNQLYAQLKTT